MRLFIFLCVCFTANVNAQLANLEGVWQGVLTTGNQSYESGTALWFDFKIDEQTGKLKGESRVETPFTNYYAYKNLRGVVNEKNTLHFEEYFIGSQKNSSRAIWCMNTGDLTYNDSTGYLSGKWRSPECKRLFGDIVLYRSKYQMSRTDTLSLYHSWFNNLANDLKRGWNAYYVRDEEMRNFEFTPVYFEHDKDDLKVEFEAYLKKMSQIVNSHSDLRIKIIGHTDSNGSDVYNVDLSARRAAQINQFLVSVGVAKDRIVIEFRGEKDPATSNATKDGKRLNRRVDFEFI